MHANQNQIHLRMCDELLKHQIKLPTFSIETVTCFAVKTDCFIRAQCVASGCKTE